MATNPETYGAMPVTGYMRQSQLIPAIFPFSSATLWRKVKAGTFPKPVKLGPRITAWRVEEICQLLQRGVWGPDNHTSSTPKTRIGAPKSFYLRGGGLAPDEQLRGSERPSLTLHSGSEIENPRPQTESADCASSLLSSRKARAR